MAHPRGVKHAEEVEDLVKTKMVEGRWDGNHPLWLLIRKPLVLAPRIGQFVYTNLRREKCPLC